MDGYSLTDKMRKARKRYRFTAVEQALFYELVAVCNGDNWPDRFDCSNIELCSALDVHKNTLIKARETLINSGLIYYQSGKSRRSVSSYSFCKPFKGEQATGSINQPDSGTDGGTVSGTDKSTESSHLYKHKTKTETKTPPVSPKGEKCDDVLFDVFWELYDKQVGDSDKIRRKWEKLPPAERLAILEYIPRYKNACPNKRYRKNPATFLDNKSWNDEIIDRGEASPNGLSSKKWTDETDTTTASRLHPALQ